MKDFHAGKFWFKTARYDAEKQECCFIYALKRPGQKTLNFTEKLELPKDRTPQKMPKPLLKALLKDLHLVLGLSYYKLYCPRTLILPTSYRLTEEEAHFWETIYEKGLGEFFYRNGIDFRGLIRFPRTANAKVMRPVRLPTSEQALLGIGGGKDSIVAGELLKKRQLPLTAFVLETGKDSPIVEDVIDAMKLPRLTIRRHLDPQIFTPPADALNGHIPISAIFAFTGLFAAALYGYRYMVVGNEASSNTGNLRYLGREINHQWSKSAEFESALQEHTRQQLSPDIQYFSAIRHLYEIRVVEEFVKMPQYFSVFTSCNRSFRVNKDRPTSRWCGDCAKCAFVFAELAAFLPPENLLPFFGKNLFEDAALQPMFEDLCGLGKLKPFDCVGTFEESREALRRAAPQWAKTAVLQTLLPKIHAHFPNEDGAALFKIQDAPTLPAHFKFLGLKNVLILGYGKEGQATERYLQKFYPERPRRIADQSQNPAYLEEQNGADFVVKTPGIPKSKLHVPYTTATQIFFAHNRTPLIGVTGSKGKSTTASLIAHLLGKTGTRTQLLGNIGAPMLDVFWDDTAPQDEATISSSLLQASPPQIFVLELSSYQLDELSASPNIAVVTNLFPEHMNYHGGIGPYYEAKKNLIRHQNPADIFIVNAAHPLLKKWPHETRAAAIPFSPWTPKQLPLLGAHNRSNVAAALAAVQEARKLLGQKPASQARLTHALQSFQALPHRLQNVGTVHGLHFYDDAISTSPESTIEAIKALSEIAPIGTIFLGGEDRGYEFAELAKILESYKIQNLVLFPQTGTRIRSALHQPSAFNVHESTSMQDAVDFAFKHTPKGTIVLLSTASPSYSLWKNFEEKGDAFQKEVKRHGF